VSFFHQKKLPRERGLALLFLSRGGFKAGQCHALPHTRLLRAHVHAPFCVAPRARDVRRSSPHSPPHIVLPLPPLVCLSHYFWPSARARPRVRRRRHFSHAGGAPRPCAAGAPRPPPRPAPGWPPPPPAAPLGPRYFAAQRERLQRQQQPFFACSFPPSHEREAPSLAVSFALLITQRVRL
jgi:hypothetical protein